MKVILLQKSFFFIHVFILLLSCFVHVSAQEKVLLSTDRDFYIAGESVWFGVGAYQLDSDKASDLSQVVYVELLNHRNNPILQVKCRLAESCLQSQIQIPDTLSTGVYSLRAYTRWMRNRDVSLFARKDLSVINPFARKSLPKGDKFFRQDTIFSYPEGGRIYTGVENRTLVFTCDSYGNPKSVRVNLLKKDGTVVKTFETGSSGYGVLNFHPREGENYEYSFMGRHYPFSEPSKKGCLLKLKRDADELEFHVVGESFQNLSLDILSQDGLFLKNISIPKNGIVTISGKYYSGRYFYALLVDESKNIYAYRAFTGQRREDKTPFIISTDRRVYKRRQQVNVAIDNIGSLKNVSVSVVKSCLLNNSKKLKNTLSDNDILLMKGKPSFKMNSKKSRLILPEIEGELLTGVITDIETGKPIVGEKFMLSFIGESPVLEFSTTDSQGRFRFVVNRYGEEEMVIQPRKMDSIRYNYKVDIDDAFSAKYSDAKCGNLVLDSVLVSKLNDAIVNMQVNTIYSTFRPNTVENDSVERRQAFYGEPSILSRIDKFIELPTVEEVVREVVPFVSLRKSKQGNYFKVFENHSLYPRQYGTMTLVDGVPVSDAKSILEIDPKDLDRIEVVNLNFYLKDEELGYLLCFYSREKDMADMNFNPRIFRQVHRGYVTGCKFIGPNYSQLQVKESRLADFRNVLYYNVFDGVEKSNELIKLHFYTSDEEAEYTIVVKGINKFGEFVERRETILVSDKKEKQYTYTN